jgi:RND family efflux transporter MFP subunit
MQTINSQNNMAHYPHRRLFIPYLLMLCCTFSAFADEPSVLVETAPVMEKSIADTLEAYGTLEPDQDQVLSLSLPHAGLINRVWVRLGQRVEAGDRLLEVVIAPDARMQYLQAQSAVDFARRELTRKQHLLEDQLATRAQVDAAQKSLNDANATLQALQKRGLNVAQETLRAPMKGIITRLDVSQGQRVQADTTAMLIAAETKLIARLGVEPEDLKDIRPGTPVTITPLFVPDVTIESTIREIHAMIDPATQLVEVLAAIPEKEVNRLVLGSRIRGRIQLESRTSLIVPRSAVLTDGGNAYLYTIADDRARRIPVQTWIEQNGVIAVSGSLKPGDRVVVTGNYELADGMAVRETH